MSHFTKVTTKLIHEQEIMEALNGMTDVVKVERDATVRGYQGKTSKAPIVAVMKGKYDIGFNPPEQGKLDKEGNPVGYSLESDWWGVRQDTKWNEQSFTKELSKRYTEKVVVNQLSLQGFTIDSNQVNEKGEIQILATRW